MSYGMKSLIQNIVNQSRLIPRGFRKGQMEIYLHSAQQQELLQLAQELGVTLPPWLTANAIPPHQQGKENQA